MSVHVQTGNGIDVVYDFDDGKQRFLGIQPRGQKLIPVRDPIALAETLTMVAIECGLVTR